MGMGKYDRSKFVFSETFNNSTGKTSGSGFIGVVLGMIAGAGIIAGTVGYFLEIPNTLEYLGIVLKLVAASTLLLGVRRLSGDFNSKGIAEADATVTETSIKADLASVKVTDVAEIKENDENKG
jgi:hypothetical protein